MADDYQVREDIDSVAKKLSDTYSKEEIDEKIIDSGADLSNYALDGHTHTYKDLEDLPIIPTDLGAIVEWDEPHYDSTYINTSSTNTHLRIARLGNFATLDYYFTLNNALPSSNVVVVDNIPSEFQPKNDVFNELTISYNGVVYLFSIVDNKVYLRHYSSGTQGGAISGLFSYITKTVTQEVGSVELSTSSSELWLDHSDTATLTATVLDEEDNPIQDANVLFYEGETTIGSDTTDENGVATIEYIPNATGTYSLTAVCDEVSSESVSVSVKDNSATTVSVSVSSATASVGDTVNVTITATDIEDNPSVGKSVIYNGSAIGTTDSNGEYATSITFDSSGTKTLTYTVDGVTGSAIVTVSKISTTTSLSASSQSVTVGSSITLTGAVNVNVANLSVGIYQGNTLVDTVYTDSNGGFTKTLTMSSSGTIVFSATFTGNDTYDTSTSSNVTVTVSKKTPTLSITGGGTYIQGTTNYIVGSLTDNATPLINATIELWEANGSSAIASTSTLSDGSYSFIIPSSTLGNFEYYVDYGGDGTYNSATSSSIYVNIVPVASVGDIELVGTKSILSYYDSEYSDITATVYDDSATPQPMANQEVVFKNGSTVLATETTDSNGECTYRYSSSGVGDVTITAECSSVSDTYEMEDCKFYDDQSTNKLSSYSTIKGSLTTSYSQNDYVQIKATSGSFNAFAPNIELSTDDEWVIEADIIQTDSSSNLYVGMILQQSSNSNNYISNLLYADAYRSYGYGTPNAYLFQDSSTGATVNNWYHFKWEFKDGKLIYTVENSNHQILARQIITLPSVYDNTNVKMGIISYGASLYPTVRFKNLKVKMINQSRTISLSATNPILSHYHSDTTPLTATVLDSNNQPVIGETVSFYKGATLIGTGTTNNMGVATCSNSYSSDGSGKFFIYAECSHIIGLYQLIDAKYYASNSRIDSEAIPYNNDRYLFSSNYSISLGDKVVFRLHSIPDTGIVGFGSLSGYDGIFYRHDGHTDLLRSVNQNRLNIESLYPSYASNPIWDIHDLCMTKIKSGSQYRANLSYDDEAMFDYWEVGNTINKIRVDKFINDDFDIEVFVI